MIWLCCLTKLRAPAGLASGVLRLEEWSFTFLTPIFPHSTHRLLHVIKYDFDRWAGPRLHLRREPEYGFESNAYLVGKVGNLQLNQSLSPLHQHHRETTHMQNAELTPGEYIYRKYPDFKHRNGLESSNGQDVGESSHVPGTSMHNADTLLIKVPLVSLSQERKRGRWRFKSVLESPLIPIFLPVIVLGLILPTSFEGCRCNAR